MWMCVCAEYGSVHLHEPMEVKRGHQIPGTGVTDGYDIM